MRIAIKRKYEIDSTRLYPRTEEFRCYGEQMAAHSAAPVHFTKAEELSKETDTVTNRPLPKTSHKYDF